MQRSLRNVFRGIVLLMASAAFMPEKAHADIYAWYILSSLSGPGTGVANVIQGGHGAPLILEMEGGTEPVTVSIRFIADIPDDEPIIAYANDLIAPDSDKVAADEVRFLATFDFSSVSSLNVGPGTIIENALQLNLGSGSISGRIALYEFDLSIARPFDGEIQLFTGTGSSEWVDEAGFYPVIHFADADAIDGFGGEVSTKPSIIIRNYVPIVDCNDNGLADADEIAQNSSLDCNGNGTLDSCELASNSVPDCNHNGKPDSCDIADHVSLDANGNGVPDECDPAPQVDCNSNGVADASEIAQNAALDCNQNGTLDACEITAGTAADCNFNGIPDSCDIAAQTSVDTDGTGVPDECEQTPPVNPIPPADNSNAGEQPTVPTDQGGHLVNRYQLAGFLKFLLLLPQDGEPITPVARMTMRTFGFIGMNVAAIQAVMELMTLPQRIIIYNVMYGVLDFWLP